MYLGDAKEPTGNFINATGNYDLLIRECKSEFKNGKERLDFNCETTSCQQFNFSLYNTEKAKWWIKMLALCCGYTESDLSKDFPEYKFVGCTFNVDIEQEQAENGKKYFVPNVKSFAKSTLKISDFDEDVPF